MALTEFWDKKRPPSREEAIKLLRSCDRDSEKIKQWNDMRERFPEWHPNLKGAVYGGPGLIEFSLERVDLHEANLAGAILQGVGLERVNLENAYLADANLQDVKAAHVNLTSAVLERAELAGANLKWARLTKAVLRHASLRGANFVSAHLEHAELHDANLVKTDLQMAHLQNAKLVGANLVHAILKGANLQCAALTGVRAEGAEMNNVDLRHAQMLSVSMNSKTEFAASELSGCIMDRYTAEFLLARNDLTRADMMQMNIEDGLARLRCQYSGFWQWLHLAALACFVFPYAWFVVKQWGVARFHSNLEHSIPLWNALLRFIVGGGEGWQQGFSLAVWPFTAFLIALCYNMVRFGLLWKTKTLELEQESRGLPVNFSLTGKWLWWYRLAKWGFVLNLLAVAYHTLHFFTQRVPID